MNRLKPKASVKQIHVALRDKRVISLTVDLDTLVVSLTVSGKTGAFDLVHSRLAPEA